MNQSSSVMGVASGCAPDADAAGSRSLVLDATGHGHVADRALHEIGEVAAERRVALVVA